MRRHAPAPAGPAPTATDDATPFPLVVFSCAVALVAGLLYILLVTVPELLSAGELRHMPSAVDGLFRLVSVHIGSYPILVLALVAAIAAPGFFNPFGARRYYIAVALLAFGFGALCIIAVEQPTRRLGEAIHDAMAIERNLPGVQP